MAQSGVITDLIEGKHLSGSSVSNATFIQVGWTAAQRLLSPGGVPSSDGHSALCCCLLCRNVDAPKEAL